MKNKLKNWQFWVFAGIILIGVCVFAFAVYYTVTDSAKIKNYTEMTAVVVDYEERKSHTHNDNHVTHVTYTYAEVVEYTVNGVTYTAVNNSSSNMPKKLGSTMKIAINPNNPSDCVFVNSQKWLYIFLFVFGGALMAFGVFMAVHLKKTF